MTSSKPWISFIPFIQYTLSLLWSNHLICTSIEPKEEEKEWKKKNVYITRLSIFPSAHHFIDCRIPCVTGWLHLRFFFLPIMCSFVLFFFHLMIWSVVILCWLLFNAQIHIFKYTHSIVCTYSVSCSLMRFWKYWLNTVTDTGIDICIGFIIRAFFEFTLSSPIVWQTPIVEILLKFQRFRLCFRSRRLHRTHKEKIVCGFPTFRIIIWQKAKKKKKNRKNIYVNRVW